MSHEVEKMVFAGATPWHGLGTEIDDATTFWDAFKMAGLDWEVKPEPLFRGDGSEVKAQASVRQSDGRVLGVVGAVCPPRAHSAFARPRPSRVSLHVQRSCCDVAQWPRVTP